MKVNYRITRSPNASTYVAVVDVCGAWVYGHGQTEDIALNDALSKAKDFKDSVKGEVEL